ncbi:general secretion pathway protein G [Selenomonas sp. WCT3]|uniref:type II secretion system protein n=1 Tax=Selenomonas sp. WCT3 TaxID=3158785 RepID=UPI00088F883F|nr:general secretion pathway protein G [Selenomonas ruminantium]
MKGSRQAGFSLLGIMIAMAILAILATIAVPKFNSAIAMANTTKVKADLTTLDSAIAIYATQTGRWPDHIEDLSDYVADLAKLKPPQGKCQLKNGKVVTISAEAYEIKKEASAVELEGADCRAACNGYTAGDFGK